jgi:tRNA threonylcarbamoyl adenosine modification protein YeaZ
VVTSVAVARGDTVLAELARPAGVRAGRGTRRGDPAGHAASASGSAPDNLLALIDAALEEAGATPRSLDAVCALRGPGSFTGLRIALATAWGLHQALGLRAAALPTLQVIAEAAAADRVLAVVDALRGEWFAQTYVRRRPAASGASSLAVDAEGPARLVGVDALRASPPAVLAGFGADRLAEEAGLTETRVVVPCSLGGVAARLAHRLQVWDAAELTEPLYLRPAPTTRSAATGASPD